MVIWAFVECPDGSIVRVTGEGWEDVEGGDWAWILNSTFHPSDAETWRSYRSNVCPVQAAIEKAEEFGFKKLKSQERDSKPSGRIMDS